MNNYQDWTPVVLQKPEKSTKKQINNNNYKLDENLENFSHKYISDDKKKKIINLRTKLKLSRNELANKSCLKPKDISDIETGKMLNNDKKIEKVLNFLRKEEINFDKIDQIK
jgi:ribosome-binding protein aMBF1 (putative translation factor)